MKITGYEALCNLGNNVDEIFEKAINGNTQCFEELENFIQNGSVRVGLVNAELPEISSQNFNLRCNKMILKILDNMQDRIDNLINKYGKDRVGIIVATTNSGVEEFEKSKNSANYELGNPAYFLSETLGLKGFYTTVSTACSSGIKAFFTARDLITQNVSDAVIVVCVDTLAKVPLYGFRSLEVLSSKQSLPFGKNREGMNIAEGCALFVLEKEGRGIDVMGLGESSDIYHFTTPNPEGDEAINAIKMALRDANLTPGDIDYINAHGTGTLANDIMESNAIYKIFEDKVPVSSTKSVTGHCLGAASGIETALCCKLLDSFDGRMYPNMFDGEFDENLSAIKLVSKNDRFEKCNICMCNSFGFGGSNAIMILGKEDE